MLSSTYCGILLAKNISNHVNWNKILNFDLSYKNLRCVKIFPNYFDHFQKMLLKWLDHLGLQCFYTTFTTCVNNWLMFLKTSKDLHVQHVGENVKLKNDDSLHIKDLVKNDMIILLYHYEHVIINSLKTYKKKINILFNWIKDFFFWNRISTRGLFCDHGLLWPKDAPQFGVFSKEKSKFLLIKVFDD